MNAQTVPPHVPPHLVRNFDYFHPGEGIDIYQGFKEVQDAEPSIFYSPLHGGHWVVTRYNEMSEIFENAADFSNRHQTVPKNPLVLPLLEYDGDIHRDFRRLLLPFFTPKSIRHLETVSRDLTISLIDNFYDKGECDFVAEFTLKMPIMILMSLLGLPPEDTPYLLPISEDIVRSGDPQVQEAAFARVFEYIATQVIPKRRANPGDDIFSALIAGTVEDGRPLTDEEIMGVGGVLIAAGLDTVAGMLGFIAIFLAENPDHRKQLVDDPSLINKALEEMLRRHHLANVARMVTRDLDFHGVQMKAGDCVLLATSLAGIDDQRYENPMEVDFDRVDNQKIVFGRGPHQCIGSFLARTELRVFLQEWLKRIPDFSIKPGETPVIVAGKANSVRYLPLVWPAPSKS
ncbi:MAG: cytochrome P450 [Tissierellales bacterium]